jgi:N-acetylmuramoyl-L-alanine amidase
MRLLVLAPVLFAAVLAAATAPAPLPTTAAAPANERVALAEVCSRLGLKADIAKNRKTVSVTRDTRKSVLTVGTREMTLDGARILLGDAVEDHGGQLTVSRIDFERRLLPLWRPDLLPNRPKRPSVIVIDPGHGGWATGAENKSLRVREKDLTLDVALRLRALLAEKGWTVFLTRDRDVALAATKEADLDARAALANEKGAEVFVSIHFDADAAGRLAGSEVFSFAPARQFATDDWSVQDRAGLAATAKPWPDEVPANRNDPWNALLAHTIHTRLLSALHTQDLGERIAHYRILAQLSCPAVLVEPAYISNPMEALRAYSPEFRQQVAAALADGLQAYADSIAALN